MPVQIEARRLNGYDLYKNVSYLRGGRHWAGELIGLEHHRNGTELLVSAREDDPDTVFIPNGDTLTITGRPS